MPPPSMRNELQQLLCSANWIRSAVPEFTTVVHHSVSLMELVYEKAGKRSKKAVSKIKLQNIGWKDIHTEAFEGLKQAAANAVRLAHTDNKKTISFIYRCK